MALAVWEGFVLLPFPIFTAMLGWNEYADSLAKATGLSACKGGLPPLIADQLCSAESTGWHGIANGLFQPDAYPPVQDRHFVIDDAPLRAISSVPSPPVFMLVSSKHIAAIGGKS